MHILLKNSYLFEIKPTQYKTVNTFRSILRTYSLGQLKSSYKSKANKQ